ncbi:MAG: hypothetical protein RLZZ502_1238, partial [Pseudomonadota bacterium]
MMSLTNSSSPLSPLTHLGPLSTAQFMKEHWQKQALWVSPANLGT